MNATRALVKNAADAEQVAYAAEREQTEGRRLEDATRAVLATSDGRQFVWALLSECGLFDDIHTTETNATFRQIGRRAVGLYLMLRCTADEYKAMQDEAAAREKRTRKE